MEGSRTGEPVTDMSRADSRELEAAGALIGLPRSDLQPLGQAAVVQPPMPDTAETRSGLQPGEIHDLGTRMTTSAPSLDPPAATTSLQNSPSFMGAPLEIREIIYRFLLSTEHTKYIPRDAEVDSLRCPHSYKFHTSIFYTENRQVYNEASRIFYMENLFIRVNMVTQTMFEQNETDADRSWYKMPILSEGTNAQACTRHAMEIDFIPGLRIDHHDRHDHFIFASQDLPMFCKTFLFQDPDLLLRMELWIIIGDEVSTDGKSVGGKTAAMKNAAAIGEGPIKNPAERGGATYEDSMEDGSTMANLIEEAKSTLSEPRISTNSTRVRRLLEPFRALHSIGYSYVDAPISGSYRLEICNSFSRKRPSIHHNYSVACSVFDEAIATFNSRNFALAISKLRSTLDTLQDFIYINEAEEATTGHPSRVSHKEALDKMSYTLWDKLARAHFEFSKELQHVRAAQTLIGFFLDSCDWDRLWQSGTHAHERAMAYYFEAEVREALDQLGEYKGRTRSDTLCDVVDMLEAALEHEPGNTMLERKLDERREEMKEAKMKEAEITEWLITRQGL